MRWIVVAAVVPAMVISGCATKRYGRLQPLTGAERVAYNCRDIDLEIAKVGATVEKIEDTDLREALRALGLALSGRSEKKGR